MSIESNLLTFQELEWLLAVTQRRLEAIENQARHHLAAELRATESVRLLIDMITELKQQADFMSRLSKHGVSTTDDRIGFLRLLRSERARLLNQRTIDQASQDEIELINQILARLARLNWEALGFDQAVYDPEVPWGGFRLSQVQARQVLNEIGRNARCSDRLEACARGDEILVVMGDDEQVVVFIERLRRCDDPTDEETLHGWLFEGIDVQSGEENFGFIWDDGSAAFLDQSPDSVLVVSYLL